MEVLQRVAIKLITNDDDDDDDDDDERRLQSQRHLVLIEAATCCRRTRAASKGNEVGISDVFGDKTPLLVNEITQNKLQDQIINKINYLRKVNKKAVAIVSGRYMHSCITS